MLILDTRISHEGYLEFLNKIKISRNCLAIHDLESHNKYNVVGVAG